MALVVTLNNCGHINVARADSISILSITLAELTEALEASDTPLVQRLKWLVREHVAAGGALTRAAVRTYLSTKDA